MNRLSIGPKERFAILKRDNFACQYCGARAPSARLCVDHITAVARGGNNDPRNLVTSCFECNAGKGTDLVSEFELRWHVWHALQERFPTGGIDGCDFGLVTEIVGVFVNAIGEPQEGLECFTPYVAARSERVRSFQEWRVFLYDEIADFHAHFGTKCVHLRNDRGWYQFSNPEISEAVRGAVERAHRSASGEAN
jgi:hypothetical protein